MIYHPAEWLHWRQRKAHCCRSSPLAGGASQLRPAKIHRSLSGARDDEPQISGAAQRRASRAPLDTTSGHDAPLSGPTSAVGGDVLRRSRRLGPCTGSRADRPPISWAGFGSPKGFRRSSVCCSISIGAGLAQSEVPGRQGYWLLLAARTPASESIHLARFIWRRNGFASWPASARAR